MKRIFLLFLTIFTAVSAFSQAGLQPAATVNLLRTEVISVGQLRSEIQKLESEPQAIQMLRAQMAQELNRTPTDAEFSRKLRTNVLDLMINERLVLQAAEKDKITITDNEVNQQLSQLKGAMAQQLGRQPTDAEFAEAVQKESGMSVADYTAQLRKTLLTQKYLMQKKGNLINAVTQPTTQEIQSEFNLRRAEFVRPETVEFFAIQIPFGADAASRNTAREKGNSLIREIGSNASVFDRKVEEARQPNSGYVAAPSSLPRIPEVQREYGQEFVDAIFALNQGVVSRLLETRNSYVILKVTRKLEFRTLSLDDEMPAILLMQAGVDPRNNVSVRVFIQNILHLRKQQAALQQATQELVAELRTGRSFQIFENNLNW